MIEMLLELLTSTGLIIFILVFMMIFLNHEESDRDE